MNNLLTIIIMDLCIEGDFIEDESEFNLFKSNGEFMNFINSYKAEIVNEFISDKLDLSSRRDIFIHSFIDNDNIIRIEIEQIENTPDNSVSIYDVLDDILTKEESALLTSAIKKGEFETIKTVMNRVYSKTNDFISADIETSFLKYKYLFQFEDEKDFDRINHELLNLIEEIEDDLDDDDYDDLDF